MTREEFLELSAGHALHALSPADEQRFAEALAEHPEWADEVRADSETAVLLGSLTQPLAPPPELRDRLLERIEGGGGSAATVPASTPLAEAATATTVRRPSVARRGWFALAASLVVLLVIGGVGAIVASQLFGTPSSDTLAQIQDQPDAQTATAPLSGGGTATAHWSGSLGKAALVSDGMPAIPGDQVFELWYVRDQTAVPAGTFTASDGKASAVLEGAMHAGDAIAVTIEPDGGSPSGSPTTPPIVSIPTG